MSHAEAKPEPMEMPVTLITWRRDKGRGLQGRVTGDLAQSTVFLPSGWGDSSAVSFWEVSSPSLFLRITCSCYLNSLFSGVEKNPLARAEYLKDHKQC